MKKPTVLTVLVGIMVGLQFLMSFAPQTVFIVFMRFGAFYTDFSDASFADVLIRLPTLFTYALLHGGWMHLILNCLIFLHLGRDVSALMGGRNFCIFFAVCAAGGAIFHAALTTQPSFLVGASASVFGIAAARGLLLAQQFSDPILRRNYILRYSAGWMLLNFAIILFTGLSSGLSNPLLTNIAWQAHAGGYFVGLATAGWFLKI